MSKTTTKAPAPTSDELMDELREIDSLVSAQMEEIAAISRMAMLWLKSPVKSVFHYETVYQALGMIWTKALDIQNSVDCTAEKLGCSSVDPERIVNNVPDKSTP